MYILAETVSSPSRRFRKDPHPLGNYKWYLRRPGDSGTTFTLSATPHGIFAVSAIPMSTNHDGLEIRQGFYLPHWRADNAIYHVVFRLADSVPASRLKLWIHERDELLQRDDLNERDRERTRRLVSERTQAFLDAGHGICFLADAQNAKIVADALKYFDGDRYRLHAWCVMPNHVHVLVEPINNHELSKITHSWKSFTAHEIRKHTGGTGSIWHRESFDHIIRNEKSYRRAAQYILENPVRADVLDGKWTGLGTESESPGRQRYREPKPANSPLKALQILD